MTNFSFSLSFGRFATIFLSLIAMLPLSGCPLVTIPIQPRAVSHGLITAEDCERSGGNPRTINGQNICVRTPSVSQQRQGGPAQDCVYRRGWKNQNYPGLSRGGPAEDTKVGVWVHGSYIPDGYTVKPC